jgi:hypothetical protein
VPGLIIGGNQGLGLMEAHRRLWPGRQEGGGVLGGGLVPRALQGALPLDQNLIQPRSRFDREAGLRQQRVQLVPCGNSAQTSATGRCSCEALQASP